MVLHGKMELGSINSTLGRNLFQKSMLPLVFVNQYPLLPSCMNEPIYICNRGGEAIGPLHVGMHLSSYIVDRFSTYLMVISQ